MRLSRLLIVLSLLWPALAWHTSDTPGPYPQQETPPNSDHSSTYPYTSTTQQQQQNSDPYQVSERPPPPRINTPYVPQSQSDFRDGLEPQYGNVGPSCSKKRVYMSENQIIDIQLSVQFGAQLVDGVFAQNFDFCVQSCCEYEGCDLALFKTDGLSQTGKTCYFVHCGLPKHCIMVENTGFMAGFLVNEPNYGDDLDNRIDGETSQQPPRTSSSDTPQVATTVPATTEVTTPTAPPTTTTETTPTTETTEVTVTQQTALAVSDSETTTVEGSHSTSPTELSSVSVPDSTEEPITTHSTTTTTDDSAHSTSDHTHTTPTTGEPKAGATNLDDMTLATRELDECGKNGCDGGGLIAVSIVGTLIIIVLLVVAAAVTRRIYKMKTRRQYRNVDYLINGMYT